MIDTLLVIIALSLFALAVRSLAHVADDSKPHCVVNYIVAELSAIAAVILLAIVIV